MRRTIILIKHTVPESHLVHIGDMTVSFALLENSIRLIVWCLIAENQRIAQIITAELSFRSLRALVISLYLEHYGEDSDYSILKRLMDKASTLENRRNQITHSIWGAGRDPQSITRIKTTAKEKYGLQLQFESVQVNELADFVSEIKLLVGDIQTFWVHLLENGKAINNPITNIRSL